LGRRTPLYDLHVGLGARMVDFGGWDMPVNYGSQIEEHHAVRQHAGIFDVSHMCVIDAKGPRVRDFFSRLIANDVAKLKVPGKALYSCMLNEQGGVIDDLIVYYMDESFFRVVVNAGTRDKDLAWMRAIAPQFGVQLQERIDLAMVAVQGPKAREIVASLLPEPHRAPALALEPFFGKAFAMKEGGEWFVARTGYTGEDGFEIMLPAPEAPGVWSKLNELGVKSAGLGARDTLRLEAAMNLYGNDMDENRNPLESGLSWTVSFENPARDFIGRKALEDLKARGLEKKFVALLLEDRGVLRGHQKVIAAAGEGEITSGTFSPTMEKSIALARVPKATGDRVQVDVRGKLLNARVVKAPFVRNGKILVS
jgi:aminomethyltransferase